MIQTRSKAGAGLAAHTTLPNGSEFPPYRNGVHVLRHILATEGFVGLYRGFFSSLATYMPSSALWWATNAIARRNLNWLVYGSTGAADGRNERHPRLELANADDPRETDEESDSHPWNEYDIPDSVLSRPPADLAILASSGIAAGFVSAFLTNPLDVLKTRIQTRTGGGRTDFAGVVRELWMRDGVPGFFRGVRARMMSTVPTSTLLIFSYELVKSLSVKVPE
jgi:solute carrier family 25 protein 44